MGITVSRWDRQSVSQFHQQPRREDVGLQRRGMAVTPGFAMTIVAEEDLDGLFVRVRRFLTVRAGSAISVGDKRRTHALGESQVAVAQ